MSNTSLYGEANLRKGLRDVKVSDAVLMPIHPTHPDPIYRRWTSRFLMLRVGVDNSNVPSYLSAGIHGHHRRE